MVGDLHHEMQIALLGQGAEPLGRDAHDLGQVGRTDVERQLIGFELAQVEEVADQSFEATGFGNDDLGGLGGVLHGAIGDGFGETSDGRQRGAQVVRDRHQELSFPVAAVGQALGHGVDRPAQRRELGVVAFPDGDPALQVTRGDLTGHLHGLDQRPRHATAELPGHQRRHEEGQAPDHNEVAPTRAEVSHLTGEDNGHLAPTLRRTRSRSLKVTGAAA